MYRFLVIIEKGNQNYGAYSPDLPGCVAVGDTVEEVEKNMREAIAMHLRGKIETMNLSLHHKLLQNTWISHFPTQQLDGVQTIF